jgi:hypothetical protein
VKSQDSDLESGFVQVWNKFLNCENQIQTNALTLKHLSIILSDINEKYQEKNSIRRIVPGYLVQKSEPNLIICPQREQIHAILSVYALTPDQPLPCPDEILYCTSHTTYEEVEIFLRIVFRSSGDKIYTLMNVQDLRYDITANVEKFLKSSSLSILNKTENFVLIITCSLEKQSQSILTSLYAKNKIMPVTLSIEDLEKYLNSKILKKIKQPEFCLTNYDPDLSPIRILISTRSGNGKSQYINELVKRIEINHKDKFNYKVFRIKSPNIDINSEIEKFFNYKKQLVQNELQNLPQIYHLDIAYEVFNNIDHYLFSLFVLNNVKHSNGFVWRRNTSNDLYLIEITPPFIMHGDKLLCIHSIINYLPKIEFKTPTRYLYDLKNGLVNNSTDLSKTQNLFSLYYKDELYQRPCFVIKMVNDYRQKVKQNEESKKFTKTASKKNNQVAYNVVDEFEDLLNEIFNPEKNIISEQECLEIILNNSELKDPSWHEIKNYCKFLNTNLIKVDQSDLIKKIPGKKKRLKEKTRINYLKFISNDLLI